MASQLWRMIRASQQLPCRCRWCLHPLAPPLPETWTPQIGPPTKQVPATFHDQPASFLCALFFRSEFDGCKLSMPGPAP